MSPMTPLVLVDAQERELGRCSIESRVTIEGAASVDLGPVGHFRILDVRSNKNPIVLVVEPTHQWDRLGWGVTKLFCADDITDGSPEKSEGSD